MIEEQVSTAVQEDRRPSAQEVEKATPVRRVLQGKKALVTGGSRGIGRATALALAQAGADVIINYQRCEEAAQEVCRAVSGFGVRARTYRADVAREKETRLMVDAVLGEFGRIDILVNNAGITRDKTFLKMPRTFWDEVLDVNLNGPFNITRAVLPGMVDAGWGRVINLTSVIGQTGGFGQVIAVNGGMYM